MNVYDKILATLELPRSIRRCASGDIRPPIIGWEAPAAWYGFPPALIPIWSDGSRPTYIGYWKHWFVQREPTFIRMYVGARRMAVEIARTAEQLFSAVVIKAIGIDDGIGEEVRNFGRQVGLNNLSEMDAVSRVTGDDPRGFVELQAFRDHTPLESIRSIGDYTGDFPVVNGIDGKEWWCNCCSFEIVGRQPHEQLPGHFSIWLVESGDVSSAFRKCLSEGDLGGAWLSLNSTGWDIRAARSAIVELGQHAKDKAFDELVDAWLSVANPSAGGY